MTPMQSLLKIKTHGRQFCYRLKMQRFVTGDFGVSGNRDTPEWKDS